MTTLWTIGHSARTLDEFIAALQSFGIQALADVRRFPASRRNPQFKTDNLKKALHQAGIQYLWLGDELGGMRDPRPDSPHLGLTNGPFRGYADWMATPGFRRGLEQLLQAAGRQRTCVMCAERPVSSCHRGLLGDLVQLAHGAEVIDIYDAGTAHPHTPTPGAERRAGGIVFLPPATRTLDEFANDHASE